MFEGMLWLWVGFNLFVLAMLALDLGVFHAQRGGGEGQQRQWHRA